MTDPSPAGGQPAPPLAAIGASLAACADWLRAGGVLCAPTESSYGLLALADRQEAVARVLACKGDRPAGKAMPLLLPSLAAVHRWARVPPWAVLLADLWPGPLTLALPARGPLAAGVAATDGTVGVRIPAQPWLLALAARLDAPLIATSANVAGATPAHAAHALRLANWQGVRVVEACADTQPSGAAPSTVVGATAGGGVAVLRPGPVEAATIEAALAAGDVPSSVDALWRGRAHFEQPLRSDGYRFNLDSVLLVDFVRPTPLGRVVDLGAGVGVVGQLLLLAGKACSLWSIERQPALARLAAHNAERNGLADDTCVQRGDLRAIEANGAIAAEAVVFNPPYVPADAGRPNACPGRDQARRECHGTLDDFVAAARRLLRPGGRMSAIVPYARRHALCASVVQHGCTPTRSRAVHAFAGHPPRHWLLEATVGVHGPEQRLGAWVVHEDDGRYRPDVAALTRGDVKIRS